VAELGNLSAGILLSPQRMSTVKIRARSLFRTPMSRNGAEGAASGARTAVEKRYTSSEQAVKTRAGSGFSSALHNPGRRFTGCTQRPAVSHLPEVGVRVQSLMSVRKDRIEKNRRRIGLD